MVQKSTQPLVHNSRFKRVTLGTGAIFVLLTMAALFRLSESKEYLFAVPLPGNKRIKIKYPQGLELWTVGGEKIGFEQSPRNPLEKWIKRNVLHVTRSDELNSWFAISVARRRDVPSIQYWKSTPRREEFKLVAGKLPRKSREFTHPLGYICEESVSIPTAQYIFYRFEFEQSKYLLISDKVEGGMIEITINFHGSKNQIPPMETLSNEILSHVEIVTVIQ